MISISINDGHYLVILDDRETCSCHVTGLGYCPLADFAVRKKLMTINKHIIFK